MTPPRIIRVEHIDFDWTDARFHGTVIRREANGVLTRRQASVEGCPNWERPRVLAALERAASDR